MKKSSLFKRTIAITLASVMVFGNSIAAVADTTSVVNTANSNNTKAGEAPDIKTGLIGYYSFDDTLENAVSTTNGTAKLHSGGNFEDADAWNKPITGTENYANGKKEKAYHFLGDNGTARGEGLELDAKVTGADFTVSFWVNPEDYGVGTTSLVFARGDKPGFSVNSLNGFRCSALLGEFWDWTNRGNNFVCLDGDDTLDGKALAGNWTMVTITNKSGEQKLYFDGDEWAQGTSTNTLVTDVLKGQSIYLGINFWDKSFKGMMDEVYVYDRALSAADVTELYKSFFRLRSIEFKEKEVTIKNIQNGDGTVQPKDVMLPDIIYTPSDTTDITDVKYESSDPSVATVDQTGKVTAVVSKGSITVTATSTANDSLKATCKVTLTTVKGTIVEDITVSPSAISLKVGETKTLEAIVTPENALDPSVTWSSSDKNVATVDQNGTITAVAAGTATITATANDGSGIKGECTVTVTENGSVDDGNNILVTGITLSDETLALKIGKTATLTATVTPENATNKGVTWSSSDSSVASVTANGEVTAVKVGTAKITVTAKDGSGITAACTVIVTSTNTGGNTGSTSTSVVKPGTDDDNNTPSTDDGNNTPSTGNDNNNTPSTGNDNNNTPSTGNDNNNTPSTGNDNNSSKKVNKGTTVKDSSSKASYKVTTAGGSGKATVEYVKPTGKAAKASTIVIPNTIKVNGVTCKVTSIKAGSFKNNTNLKKLTIGKNIKKIGKNAFYNCKNMKTLTIKAKKLTAKNIGKNAFKGISTKGTIKVPKGKVKAYTKLFRQKGLSSKVKIVASK